MHIASCGHPQLLWRVGNGSVLNIEGYSYGGLPVEGSTIRSAVLLLTEPNSATCTENGEWEPSPLCKRLFTVSTLS